MKVVITHVRNEAYLLKWWIPHHQKRFDHGVVIDYHSTDGSIELIKQLAPTWEIVTSRHQQFDAENCDQEVSEVEYTVHQRWPGAWTMALCATEFFIGNTDKLVDTHPQELFIPCDVMVDKRDQVGIEPDENIPLVKQRNHGIPLEWNEATRYNRWLSKFDSACVAANIPFIGSQRLMRSLHNFPYDYLARLGPGRHVYHPECHPSADFRIFWYGYSPVTVNSIARKIAMKDNVSQRDVDLSRAAGHLNLSNEETYFTRYDFHERFGLTDFTPVIEQLEGDRYDF